MARNIIEEIRKDAISDIFGNRKFCSCWEIWKPLIKEKCDNCNHAKEDSDIPPIDNIKDMLTEYIGHIRHAMEEANDGRI